jgi:hypothetical protein
MRNLNCSSMSEFVSFFEIVFVFEECGLQRLALVLLSAWTRYNWLKMVATILWGIMNVIPRDSYGKSETSIRLWSVVFPLGFDGDLSLYRGIVVVSAR